MAAVAGEAEQIGSAGARALAAAVLRLRVDMPDLPVAQIARAAAEQVDVEWAVVVLVRPAVGRQHGSAAVRTQARIAEQNFPLLCLFADIANYSLGWTLSGLVLSGGDSCSVWILPENAKTAYRVSHWSVVLIPSGSRSENHGIDVGGLGFGHEHVHGNESGDIVCGSPDFDPVRIRSVKVKSR